MEIKGEINKDMNQCRRGRTEAMENRQLKKGAKNKGRRNK
jgi:hypothetical protein